MKRKSLNDDINPSYVTGQIEKASNAPEDKRLSTQENEARKSKKLEAWVNTLEKMFSGALQIGSRNPIQGTPVWLTPEVLDGGFVTGKLLATLKEGEVPNSKFTAAEGLSELSNLLDTGNYRVKLAEHGALMVLAWLYRNNFTAEGEQLLNTILPYFDKIRFYPDTADTPIETKPRISLTVTGGVIHSLTVYKENLLNPYVPRVRRRQVHMETVRDWLPLKYDLLALFGETIECGHAPAFQLSPNGEIITKGKRSPVYVQHPGCPKANDSCGWPLQTFPVGWEGKARELLKRYQELSEHQIADGTNKAHTKKGSVYHTLVTCLTVCVQNGSKALKASQVGMLRTVMAGCEKKRGFPGSYKFGEYQARIKQELVSLNEKPSPTEYTDILIERLRKYSPEFGIAEPEAVLTPIILHNRVCQIPKSYQKKIIAAREGTLKDLLERKLIKSSEQIATLVPVLVSEVSSQGISDPVLRRLCYAITVAFNSRRSILLTNLQKQVSISELPWFTPIQSRKSPSSLFSKAPIETLENVVTEVLQAFPQTIVPNKLLQSFRQLTSTCLVDELAADIFQGRFSEKFLEAAKIASELLSGSVYEQYYNLKQPFADILSNSMNVEKFGKLCYTLAGFSTGYRSPAENGHIIEQEQILTTHNLAVLCKILSLEKKMDWSSLVVKTWKWILHALTLPTPNFPTRLRLCKDVAYAWRQLIFYFSLLPHKGPLLTQQQKELIGTMRALIKNVKDERIAPYAEKSYLIPLEELDKGKSEPLYAWAKGAEKRVLPPKKN